MGTGRTDEFRKGTVRIALTSGRARKQIADDLGVGMSTFNKWITGIVTRMTEEEKADFRAAMEPILNWKCRHRCWHHWRGCRLRPAKVRASGGAGGPRRTAARCILWQHGVDCRHGVHARLAPVGVAADSGLGAGRRRDGAGAARILAATCAVVPAS